MDASVAAGLLLTTAYYGATAYSGAKALTNHARMLQEDLHGHEMVSDCTAGARTSCHKDTAVDRMSFISRAIPLPDVTNCQSD